MGSISAPVQTLLSTDAVAHVWTRNKNGTPQVSVVWVLAHDDEILFGTDAHSQKAINLRRDPHIVLSIEDTERNERGYQRHLVVYGQAAIEVGPAPELLDRMAMKYAGLQHHPLVLRDSPTCAVVRVAIDRISGVGPWINEIDIISR